MVPSLLPSSTPHILSHLLIQRILGTKGDLAVEKEALLVENQVDAKEFAPQLVKRFEGRPFVIDPKVCFFVFCFLLFVICYLLFVICYLLFVIVFVLVFVFVLVTVLLYVYVSAFVLGVG